MERVHKKFGHGHGLPPIPLPPSVNGKKNIGNASKEAEATQNQATQDLEQEAKKQKRVLANRQYSQRYRIKQLDYIMQLEREVKALEAEVIISSPRVKYMHNHKSLLRSENDAMNEKLAAFSGELAYKEAEYEKLKRERQILKELQELQELMNLPNQGFNEF